MRKRGRERDRWTADIEAREFTSKGSSSQLWKWRRRGERRKAAASDASMMTQQQFCIHYLNQDRKIHFSILFSDIRQQHLNHLHLLPCALALSLWLSSLLPANLPLLLCFRSGEGLVASKRKRGSQFCRWLLLRKK